MKQDLFLVLVIFATRCSARLNVKRQAIDDEVSDSPISLNDEVVTSTSEASNAGDESSSDELVNNNAEESNNEFDNNTSTRVPPETGVDDDKTFENKFSTESWSDEEVNDKYDDELTSVIPETIVNDDKTSANAFAIESLSGGEPSYEYPHNSPSGSFSTINSHDYEALDDGFLTGSGSSGVESYDYYLPSGSSEMASYDNDFSAGEFFGESVGGGEESFDEYYDYSLSGPSGISVDDFCEWIVNQIVGWWW